jgi:amidase
MSQSEYRVEGVGIRVLAADMAAGRVTSAGLVDLYEARIAAFDRAGPALHAVLMLNPDARREAEASDARRRSGATLGPLDGVPLLIKDNVEVAGAMPTTAGSLALASNVTGRDAPLVARLRAAGAVILGKTNLSEWANFRSTNSISGWSGVGGLTRNPWATDRSACGSSTGSGAAVAASFAAAAIGTETDGSVTCPASLTGLVGLKPTVGMVSRTHVVPISSSQDTAGPMTHDVADAALLLGVMAGTDPSDPATRDADAHRASLAAPLVGGGLQGVRLGVARFLAGHHPATDAVFERALATLRQAGATLVEVTDGPDLDRIGDLETKVLLSEFKATLDAYLATTPAAVRSRSLAAVMAFNEAHADRELGLFGQEQMAKAEATTGLDDPAYREAAAAAKRLAGAEGIDRLLARDRLDALVAPTGGPAWVIDLVNGDHDIAGASTLPAVAGYPHLTVPMGDVSGLPVGISFVGAAWSDRRLLEMGAAFEARAGINRHPEFPAAAPMSVSVEKLLLPVGR